MKEEVSRGPRIGWIDRAKGIAIVLVVLGHVLGGGTARGWFGDGHAARLVYQYIYLFHMPLFFLISGMLSIDSMRARPGLTAMSRVRGIAWPYFLWGFIAMAIVPFVAQFMSAAHVDSFAISLWKLLTGQTSWFLWTLFVMEILILPVARMPLPLLLACSLLALAISGQYTPFGVFTPVVINMPFFLLGCLVAKPIKAVQPSASPARSAGLAIFGIVLFATLALFMAVTAPSEVLYLFGGVVGSAAVMAFALAVRAEWLQRWLQSLGLASLAIFLVHPFFQGATRELLVDLGGLNPRHAFLCIVLASIAGPWLVWHIAERLGAGWLFRFPSSREVVR